jgi:hypothetical protein
MYPALPVSGGCLHSLACGPTYHLHNSSMVSSNLSVCPSTSILMLTVVRPRSLKLLMFVLGLLE